jgi:hypothetical protein
MPRLSTIALCFLALLIVVTSFTRGYGVFALFAVLLNLFRTLSSWIFPHWLNRFVFSATGYCIQSMLSFLKFVVSCWESSFDTFMNVFGQKPSDSRGSITSIFTLPLRASGVSSLISILYDELMRVPEALDDFSKSFNMTPDAIVVAITLATTVYYYYDEKALGKDASIADSAFFGVVFLICVMLAADVAVFFILVVSTLVPLICIFACLAAAAYAVNYFRPNVRPKHAAPCMAVIAAQ